MKFIRLATMMMVVLGILCSCGQQGNKPVGLDNSPVVAQRVVTPQGDEVVVANMDLMTDTIDFTMSLLLSDLEIVKLDDRDEALIGIEPWATVSDNYVAVDIASATSYYITQLQAQADELEWRIKTAAEVNKIMEGE